MIRLPGSLAAALFLVSVAISSCSTAPSGGGGESAFIGVRQVQVKGVTYKVGRKQGSSNFFVVTTAGDRQGSRWGASTAVMNAFQCQRVSLKPLDDGWRRAEGRGSFCSSKGQWHPTR
jgi:hypothetical protein